MLHLIDFHFNIIGPYGVIVIIIIDSSSIVFVNNDSNSKNIYGGLCDMIGQPSQLDPSSTNTTALSHNSSVDALIAPLNRWSSRLPEKKALYIDNEEIYS